MDKRFFGTLELSSKIIDRASELVKDRKIIHFDSPTIEMLVNGGVEQFLIIKQRPRQLKEDTILIEKELVRHIVTQNGELEKYCSLFEKPISAEQSEFFELMGISTLHTI